MSSLLSTLKIVANMPIAGVFIGFIAIKYIAFI